MLIFKSVADVIITMLLTIATTIVMLTVVGYIFSKEGIALQISIGSKDSLNVCETPAVKQKK
jgi:hypothetical protein